MSYIGLLIIKLILISRNEHDCPFITPKIINLGGISNETSTQITIYIILQ